MLLTIEWRLKTPIYISQERSCNLLMGCWWWDLGREDEESDCQYWQWCQCAAVMEQGWGSSCWPIVSPSPPRPGHDGCHPLGGAQWIAQKTALKSSRSNPGIIDVGIELDCVIIWLSYPVTNQTVPYQAFAPVLPSIVQRFVHRWLCTKLCKTLKEVQMHFSYKLW